MREGEHFRSAILFGSHARGDAGEDSYVDIAYDVLLDTGALIQPVPVRNEEWEYPERHSNPRLLSNIRREGRALPPA